MKRASLFVGVPSAMIVLGLLLSTTPAEAVLSTGWGEAEPISAYDHIAGLADVAVDASGNAVAVWCQFDGTRNNIWANRYVVGTGKWGVAEPIEANDGDTDWPTVAVDGLGNAVAVWQQDDGIRNNIWANRYVAGTGKWGVAEQIGTDYGAAWLPVAAVAVDASGNAIAVWVQDDGTQYNVCATRYVVGIGWGKAEQIEANDGDAQIPAVAVDASGNAIAVWYQFDGTRNNIYANRYVVGIGWGEEAEPIEANDGDAQIPAVAVDASGNAIAVWYQSDDTSLWNIWANRYDVVAGWGEEVELIETRGAMADWSPAVAADASGNAIAVWGQPDGIRDNIWANRYVAGTGKWGVAEQIETNDGSAGWPAVAVAASGNAIAVWNQSDDALSNIYANRYVVGSGWEGAELIETSNAGPAFLPRVAADASGNAMAVWMLFGGDQPNIWANRYVAPDITPPPLTLSSPVDGMTTDSPLVIVSGKTEPGATISANGVLAAVLGDGSFSCVIALKQGSNTIVVTATDSSGNSATLSRTVVYDATLPDVTDEFDDELLDLMNKLDDELDDVRDELNATQDELGRTNDTLVSIRSQNLMLTVALVAVSAIAAVSLAMYFSLRKMMPPSGNAQARTEPPPPPGG